MPCYSAPAIPPSLGAIVRNLVDQMQESEWLDRTDIRRRQDDQLATLLQFAARECPFYSDRFNRAGLPADGRILPESLHRLPLLSRKDVQDNFDGMKARNLPPGTRPAGEMSTSGSTAAPVRIVVTTANVLMWNACYVRDAIWAGLDFRGTLASLRHFPKEHVQAHSPQGGAHPAWGGQIGEYLVTGPSCSMDVGQDAEAQLAFLQRNDPWYICSYPSNLEIMGRIVESGGIEFPSLKRILTIGEVLPSTLRAYIERVYRVGVWDVYSCVETGYIASQCPSGHCYHVHDENVLLEILDGNNQPCPPGTAGRVVITSLMNFGMPLIRYDIGDYGVLSPRPCPCGRGLTAVAEVIGRQRGQLLLPDGRVKFSSQMSIAIRDAGFIRQFKVVQHERDRIEVFVVPMDGFGDAQKRKIEESFHACLGFPMKISFTLVKQIERTPGGKYLDFVCNAV